MGKSASGKDTIYQRIHAACPELGSYVMYTTRPMRTGEIDGVTYHFVEAEALADYERNGRLIEKRTYQTVYGPWTYATVDDGQIDLSERDYLIPGTLESWHALREYYGREALIPIYIEVEDGLRLERALARERKQQTPKYAELCRRFLADTEDFSEERLREAGIRKHYQNDDLETCTAEILEDIRRNAQA